jgi:phosphoglycerate dehydrogenase-like enzyme
MTWKVLVSAPYMLPEIDRFRAPLMAENVELVAASVNERLSEAELLDVIADYDGIICGDDRITAKVIAAASRLKVISKWGTGIDSIDAEAAAARGIPVCRTRNAFSEPVADSVLGYMLNFARRPHQMNQAIRGANGKNQSSSPSMNAHWVSWASVTAARPSSAAPLHLACGCWATISWRCHLNLSKRAGSKWFPWKRCCGKPILSA